VRKDTVGIKVTWLMIIDSNIGCTRREKNLQPHALKSKGLGQGMQKGDTLQGGKNNRKDRTTTKNAGFLRN